MLQASKEWSWFACHNTNRLLLDLGPEMQFQTPFKIRQLTEHVLDNPDFSLEDAAFYKDVYQYLSGFTLWTPAQLCQIALNATAAKFHLKPVLAKSWFFAPYQGSEPSVEAIVTLRSGQDRGHFLIVDHDAQGSLCLYLENAFALDENLTLNQFEVIRVLNDRIHPLMPSSDVAKRA